MLSSQGRSVWTEDLDYSKCSLNLTSSRESIMNSFSLEKRMGQKHPQGFVSVFSGTKYEDYFHSPTSRPIPIGSPTIQFSSNVNYPELAQTSPRSQPRLRAQPHSYFWTRARNGVPQPPSLCLPLSCSSPFSGRHALPVACSSDFFLTRWTSLRLNWDLRIGSVSKNQFLSEKSPSKNWGVLWHIFFMSLTLPHTRTTKIAQANFSLVEIR